MIRWHECKRHPVATVVVVVSLLTVLGLVVLLAANPVDPPPRVPAWLPEVLVPTSANAWPGALLIVALGVHFAAVTRVRSGRSIALESAILWSDGAPVMASQCGRSGARWSICCSPTWRRRAEPAACVSHAAPHSRRWSATPARPAGQLSRSPCGKPCVGSSFPVRR